MSMMVPCFNLISKIMFYFDDFIHLYGAISHTGLIALPRLLNHIFFVTTSHFLLCVCSCLMNSQVAI